MPAGDFYSVLTAAINDLVESGFDSVERIEKWTRELRAAAERSMISPESLEQMLRDGLAAVYRRMVDQDGVLKFSPGIERFTLEKIKPTLRAELDRRIMASANLIRLNRAQAIDKTLQRFQGWATSIPKGGTDNAKKRETKENVRKSLASLPFEERRVLIDQGHKLTAAISEIVASDGGAIAGRWVSHFSQPGYNYREDHKERDFRVTGNVYLVRDSWAQRLGYVKPMGRAGYTDEITKPGEEVFCFPGDSRVPFADRVEKAYRRFYSGELTTIITASGKTLRATPNHPVLTVNGWLSIGSLDEGNYVIEAADEVREFSEQHKDYAVPFLAEVFRAVSESGIAQVSRGQLQQFHGDGSHGDVDIVDAARPLTFGFGPRPSHRVRRYWLERGEQFGLTVAKHRALSLRALKFFLKRCLAAGASFVRGFSQSPSAVLAFTGHPDYVSGGAVAQIDAEMFSERAAGNLQAQGQAEQAFPFKIRASRVVSIERRQWSGHVYNLQTERGWYVVGGIIAHNCRCYYRWRYSLSDLPVEMLTAKGKAALEQAKARARSDSAFADEAGERAARPDAEYIATWPNKVTRCQRCASFVRLGAATAGNACSAVAGEISAHGHCRLFSIGHGASVSRETSVPVPVDRDHDVAWMFVVSADGRKLYADRTLPRSVTIAGRTVDPAEIGWAHEIAEWLHMMRLVAAFLERFLREPSEAERMEIYRRSHEVGIAAERARCERLGVDWDAWEAWSRGELARLEHRAIRRPPPDPHVRPAPHDRREPMEAVA